MASASHEIDVLIVGAGPVGLTMACTLAQHGVVARIVDAQPGPTDQSRALGIQARTLEILGQLGDIPDTMIPRGRKLAGLAAFSDRRPILDIPLTIDAEETRYPFALILPQSETERILEARLPLCNGGSVERSTTVESIRPGPEGVTVRLIDSQGVASVVRTRWLIGCDGARSVVRKACDIAFEGATYDEGFFLADLHLDWDRPADRITAVLTPEGPLFAFPLPEPGRWRLVKGMENQRSPDELGQQAILDRFRQLVRDHAPGTASVSDPSWTSAFRIHHRVAARFRSGRCFLVGDAAHIHSPAGGQGMNTGIQDAFNLAWKLALVVRGEAPESLLDSFAAERRPVALGVVRATHFMTRMVTLKNPIARGLRDRLMPLVVNLPGMRHRMMQGLSELGVCYPNSPIVAEDVPRPWFSEMRSRFGQAPGPGDRVPDLRLEVLGPTPGRFRFHDFLRGTHSTLVLFLTGQPSIDALFQPVSEFLRDHHRDRIQVLAVSQGPTVPDGFANALALADRRLHDRFGSHDRGVMVLIRHDGYVGYRASPPDVELLAAYLRRIYLDV